MSAVYAHSCVNKKYIRSNLCGMHNNNNVLCTVCGPRTHQIQSPEQPNITHDFLKTGPRSSFYETLLHLEHLLGKQKVAGSSWRHKSLLGLCQKKPLVQISTKSKIWSHPLWGAAESGFFFIIIHR